MMTKEKWQQLEDLCREALDEAPDRESLDHPLFQSLRTAGAFAASVVHHMSQPTENPQEPSS